MRLEPLKHPMSPVKTSPHPKSRQRWIIGALLCVVLLGSLASFLFSGGNHGEEQKAEEYQIVDITIPPPPPPPLPEDEDQEEPEELEEPIEPLEMSESPKTSTEESSEIDLGIDIGELASSTGSGFVMDIPHFGRGSGGGSDGQGNLMEGVADSPPFPVNKPQPTYPGALLKKGIGGKVLVTCEVDDSGRILSTSIKTSSGHPDLDKAAIAAVNKWKFKPGTKDGRNVKAICIVPFNFEIKKS